MAQGEQTGIIGKGIIIRGNLTGGGDLVIEGRVEGQIALKNHLTIEGTGKVQADIRAEELTINGEASGNIDASAGWPSTPRRRWPATSRPRAWSSRTGRSSTAPSRWT